MEAVTNKSGRRISAAALLLAVMMLSPLAYTAELIAHAGVSPGPISRNEARLLFLMRRQHWPDGEPIKVFVLGDNHPLHQAFCKDQLRILPRRLRVAWERQVYAGIGQIPVRVGSLDEMVQRVGSTPGGIGYFTGNESHENVQVLQIQ